MKTFFVVNPKSANGATGKRWGELAALIARTLSDFGVEFTKGEMDAMHIARAAIKNGYECIVAVGGDGTINEVVNGFFEDGKAINPQAALGVLPRGTGGDFRKTFDWDLDSEAAIKRLKTPDTRPLDVGLLEFRGRDGGMHRRYFANICSFGVSGLVDQEVNTTSKLFGGTVSFMLGSLKALSKYRDQKVRVSFDDGPVEALDVTTLSVANGKYFGGGMKVAPDADVSDGIFDVTVWSGYGLSDFVIKSQGVYSGAHVNWKGTRTLRAKKVHAESDEQVLIDCDGEQPGSLPCTMTILPAAIRLKV
ncbi:MAG: diacylglycerol/lipid kinase family protein [Myxococcota bacterium]